MNRLNRLITTQMWSLLLPCIPEGFSISPGVSVLGEPMIKSQRKSGVSPKPGQQELARACQVSQEGLSGDPKPDAILVEPEG